MTQALNISIGIYIIQYIYRIHFLKHIKHINLFIVIIFFFFMNIHYMRKTHIYHNKYMFRFIIRNLITSDQIIKYMHFSKKMFKYFLYLKYIHKIVLIMIIYTTVIIINIMAFDGSSLKIILLNVFRR